MEERSVRLQIKVRLSRRAAIKRFCGLNGLEMNSLLLAQLEPLFSAIDSQRVPAKLKSKAKQLAGS